MDASVSGATTPAEYVGGTADYFRTDLYSYECPKMPTQAEYIEKMSARGVKFTPELKSASVNMSYEGD
jgi:glycerophosphoryl diester phosphodiesterase